MSNVGYATLNVIPSVRGVGAAVSKQVVAPVAAAGVSAGRSAGSGIVSGIVNGARSAIATAGKVIAVGMGTVVTAASVVAAVAFKGGFSRALNIQDAQKQLLGLGHSTDTVAAIMDNALASVKGTAFGLDTAATLAASVVAAGIKPGEELTRVLKLTADAATIAKTPLGEMGGIINKVASSGKLSTEVLQQFSERGVPLLQFVAAEYGVTAAEASKMVSDGEVDFARFQNALETGVGGAALSSGETARGAFANIGAALSRFGALFATPLVAGAPSLFISVAGAVDRATTAVTPFAAEFATRLVPALAAAQRWVDGLDFGVMIGGVKGLYDLVIGGDFTGALSAAFGWQEDSRAVDVLLTIREAVLGVVGAIRTGNWDTLTSSFGDVGGIVQPLLPLFVGVAKGLGGIAGSVGDVIGAGLPLLVPILQVFTNILGYLGEHTELLTPLILGIAAAFLIQRTAAVAMVAVNIAAIPLEIARTAAMFASAGANNALANATLFAAGAERQGLAARLPATGAIIVQTAANVGARVALIAGAVATGIATAAQWAWNIAVSANPLGLLIAVVVLVIAAIAALVAGIIWVANETTFFQDLWSNACKVISTVTNWLWTVVISPVLKSIGALFTWLYKNAVEPAINGVAGVFRWLYSSVIKPVFDSVASAFRWIYNSIIAPIIIGIALSIAIWQAAISFLYQKVIRPVFDQVASVFRWIYNTIIIPIIIGIALYIAIWQAAIKFLYQKVIRPVFDQVAAAFNWLYQSIIMPVILGIVSFFKFFMDTVKRLYTQYVLPIFGFIAFAANTLGDAISAAVTWIVKTLVRMGKGAANLYNSYVVPIFGFISAAAGALGSAISSVVNWIVKTLIRIGTTAADLYNLYIVTVFAMIRGAFNWLGQVAQSLYSSYIQPAIDGIGAAFNWLWNNVISPIGNWIAGAMNNVGSAVNSVFGGMANFIGNAFSGALGLVRGPINGIIGLVNSAIGALNGVSVTIPDFVPGIGGQRFGINIPRIPMLATGADVMARAGGTLAVLGEGGRAETVTDLGNTNRLIDLTSRLAERAVAAGGGDRILKVENLGYNPGAIFAEWDTRQRQAALLEGLSISGSVA